MWTFHPLRTKVESDLKSSTILPFFAIIVAFAVSCGSEGPTSTGIPQSADEIKIAGQELIDAWLEATRDRNPSAMYALLARNITDRCIGRFLEFSFQSLPDAIQQFSDRFRNTSLGQSDANLLNTRSA